MKRNLLFITLILLTACTLFKKDKDKVTITDENPEQGNYTDRTQGQQETFSFTGNSTVYDNTTNSIRENGAKVVDSNTYNHTHRKGFTTIEAIAKTADDSAKVLWGFFRDWHCSYRLKLL